MHLLKDLIKLNIYPLKYSVGNYIFLCYMRWNGIL